MAGTAPDPFRNIIVDAREVDKADRGAKPTLQTWDQPPFVGLGLLAHGPRAVGRRSPFL